MYHITGKSRAWKLLETLLGTRCMVVAWVRWHQGKTRTTPGGSAPRSQLKGLRTLSRGPHLWCHSPGFDNHITEKYTPEVGDWGTVDKVVLLQLVRLSGTARGSKRENTLRCGGQNDFWGTDKSESLGSMRRRSVRARATAATKAATHEGCLSVQR